MIARLAARLESGAFAGLPAARALSRAYARLADPRVARPLRLPPGARVVGIGGATLGGSGKTCVAVAYARALAPLGRVAFVGHGYGAHPERARRVRCGDPVNEVGDDALVAAQALGDVDVPVWIAPTRQQAIEAAARGAEIVVVDGLLQAHPVRLARSVLVLDAHAPWGAGLPLPVGDLRASPEALVQACDEIVWARDRSTAAAPPSPRSSCSPVPLEGKPARSASIELLDARANDGSRVSLAGLADRRVGLLLALAHPERVLFSLRARGIEPRALWRGADHRAASFFELGRIRRLAGRARLDAWLATTKCALHFTEKHAGAPVLPLWTSTSLDPAPGAVVDSSPCAPREPS
jgi:tetraacyldisaccharide 4'-kinase